ncbi:MAG: lipid-A-disaccharide synthase N-terminal domain-containing protein [Gemmatimonadota bacterium]|jgi:lipid-A-disaccharide synthase-like uncharacterized protein
MSPLFGALLVTSRIAWVALGFMAQVIFSARFLIQWLASEREGSSVVPVSFWYLSLAGATLLLLYAVHRRDPVFILGQSAGLFIYVRNLILIRRHADGLERGDG